MKESPSDRFGGDESSVALLAALAVLVTYMAWVGISGQPLPRWVLWLATIL